MMSSDGDNSVFYFPVSSIQITLYAFYRALKCKHNKVLKEEALCQIYLSSVMISPACDL